MNAPKSTDRLKVVLLSLPPRTQAVLEFFFSSAGRSSFQTVDEASAEAAIFDLDTLESREHWGRFRAAQARPGIALAVQEQDIEGAVWVHKPVTPAALMAAMARLRRLDTGRAVNAGNSVGGASSAEAGHAAAPEPVQTKAQPAAVPAPAPAVEAGKATSGRPATPAGSSTLPASRGAEPPVSLGSLVERAAQLTPSAPVEARDQAPETVSAPSMDSLLRPLRDDAVPATTGPSGPARPASPEGRRSGIGGLLRRWLGGRDAGTPEVSAPLAVPAAPAAAPSLPATPVAPVVAAEPAPTPESAAVNPVAVPRSVVGPVTPMVPAVVLTGTQDAGGDRPIPVAELVDEPLLCGTRDDLSEDELSSRADLRYTLDATALSALIEAYLVGLKWQVPTQVEFPQGVLVVDTTQNLAYIDFDQSLWSELVSRPLPKRPKTRAISRQEFAEMSARWADRVTVARLDALLWRAGLETSVGRLPTGVSLQKPVFLKHWPNLTRVHNTPHAMRIAALWATRGAGLLETVSTLKVAQRHVFAFYNAALALDLITDDDTQVRRAQRRGAKNKGLLRRLFGWLQK